MQKRAIRAFRRARCCNEGSCSGCVSLAVNFFRDILSSGGMVCDVFSSGVQSGPGARLGKNDPTVKKHLPEIRTSEVAVRSGTRFFLLIDSGWQVSGPRVGHR